MHGGFDHMRTCDRAGVAVAILITAGHSLLAIIEGFAWSIANINVKYNFQFN